MKAENSIRLGTLCVCVAIIMKSTTTTNTLLVLGGVQQLLLWLLLLPRQSDASTTIWQDLLQQHNVREPRIVGGVPSDGYPAFGSPAGNPLCGCTLIYRDVALSAAHCRGSFLGQTIYFGGTEVDGDDAQDAAVAVGEYPFPQFDYQNQRHDIMLIQLSHPIQNVAPAKWNTDHSAPVDEALVKTIGYGDTHPRRGRPSQDLLEIEVPVVNINDCNSRNAYNNAIDDATMICAGMFQTDSCNGDSGNPLLDSETGIIVGVVSFGVRCGSANHPGIYTRVSAYDSYLQEGICALSVDPPCGCDASCPDDASSSSSTDGTSTVTSEVSPGPPPPPTPTPAPVVRQTFQPAASPLPAPLVNPIPRPPIILEPVILEPVYDSKSPSPPTESSPNTAAASSSWTRRQARTTCLLLTLLATVGWFF